MAGDAPAPVTAAQIAQFEAEFRRRHPNADEVFLAYGVASAVILAIMGPAWWQAKLASERGDPYLAGDRADEPGRYIHQTRVYYLARDLQACQNVPGFREQLEALRTRSLIGVMHELRVAQTLIRRGHEVSFVTPTGVRGADYDLLVDSRVAVEVKSKEDGSTYTTTSLRRVLNDARGQLPPAGPGVIALRIPDAWATDTTFVTEANDEFKRALRNSGRINAILVQWDEWKPRMPQGVAHITRIRAFVNERPRSDMPGLAATIRSHVIDEV
jgi:hypothetical protein